MLLDCTTRSYNLEQLESTTRETTLRPRSLWDSPVASRTQRTRQPPLQKPERMVTVVLSLILTRKRLSLHVESQPSAQRDPTQSYEHPWAFAWPHLSTRRHKTLNLGHKVPKPWNNPILRPLKSAVHKL
eukprot:244676-Amphidinium_carterae.1